MHSFQLNRSFVWFAHLLCLPITPNYQQWKQSSAQPLLDREFSWDHKKGCFFFTDIQINSDTLKKLQIYYNYKNILKQTVNKASAAEYKICPEKEQLHQHCSMLTNFMLSRALLICSKSSPILLQTGYIIGTKPQRVY